MENNCAVDPDEFDSPWKEALEYYFVEFMRFFYPHAHAAIDWSKPYEFLESELQAIMRDADKGRCHADKIVKVWLLNGDEQWIAIHIEIQGSQQSEFARRMYVYNYRIFDTHGKSVASFALLTDDSRTWHPKKFEYDVLGCNVRLKFQSVKLNDFRKRWKELERSSSPMAILVLAHLQTLDTRKKDDERLLSLRKLLYLIHKNGLSVQDFRELFRLLNWMMRLPESCKERIIGTAKELTEEKYNVPFVDLLQEKSFQVGDIRTLRKILIKFLSKTFNPLPSAVTERINAIDDESVLNELTDAAFDAKSFKDFEGALNKVQDKRG